jgi:Uma2 family endonuclease
MSLTTQPPAAPATRDPDVPDVPIYRLSVAQYHAMAEAGILNEDDPVELLEGWLVRKMTKHPPHTLGTLRARRVLEGLLSDQWYVNSQEPIATAESEPEPDVFVARGVPSDYEARHPGPEEVVLVVEVADRSLVQDRGTKKRVYARAGIAVYWIVNLIERQVEVYTDPTGPAEAPDYRQRREYRLDDAIPLVLGGAEIGRIGVREVMP